VHGATQIGFTLLEAAITAYFLAFFSLLLHLPAYHTDGERFWPYAAARPAIRDAHLSPLSRPIKN
jgi:hypothetical protein